MYIYMCVYVPICIHVCTHLKTVYIYTHAHTYLLHACMQAFRTDAYIRGEVSFCFCLLPFLRNPAFVLLSRVPSTAG